MSIKNRIVKLFVESEILKGGLADNKTLQDIANHHKVSLDDISKQVKKGIPVEKEHTNDDKKALEIVMDHLWEFSDYYDRLEKAEK
jgi:hypothetical protein